MPAPVVCHFCYHRHAPCPMAGITFDDGTPAQGSLTRCLHFALGAPDNQAFAYTCGVCGSTIDRCEAPDGTRWCLLCGPVRPMENRANGKKQAMLP